MASISGNDTIVLDLDVHDVTTLMLEPAVNYDNVMQRTLGLYKFVFGQNKWNMLHLNRPKAMLQPKTNCETWKPFSGFRLRPHQIQACEFEINGDACHDQFDADCLKNLRAATDERNRLSSTIDAIDMAMILQIRMGLVDDMFRVAWFGNENFGQMVDNGTYTPQDYDNKSVSRLTDMMEHCNGWWSEIDARTRMNTDDPGRIRYVDTNNGTTTGNAMRAENIANYLRQLRAKSDTLLKFWNINRPANEWPAYWLQKGLFDALVKYYEAQGYSGRNSDARQFEIEGLNSQTALMFEGYPVFMVPEWTMFDNEMGHMGTNGYSKTQRAIFSARENLCGITNASTLEGRPQSSIVVQESPLLKDKGKKYIYGALSYGFGIAQPKLMTVGWNSSENFV